MAGAGGARAGARLRPEQVPRRRSLAGARADLLRERTGVPVVGVVPYLEDLALPEEDAASLRQRSVTLRVVDIAVVRLPHVANFDEFGPLAMRARRAGALRHAAGGAARAATWSSCLAPRPRFRICSGCTSVALSDAHPLAGIAHDTPLLGICGGYQMLGRRGARPTGAGVLATLDGGSWRFLPLRRSWRPKSAWRTRAVIVLRGFPGVWCALAGARVEGYEIHMGHTAAFCSAVPPIGSDRRRRRHADGRIAGTYLHGLLEQPVPRHRLLAALAARRGFNWSAADESLARPYELLADTLREVSHVGRPPESLSSHGSSRRVAHHSARLVLCAAERSDRCGC